ncbi:MAG: mechanosensitive ion channel [Chlorobi bacterium]|nr:mechanosensitive ion channel [Chlorobiota bacterium]
MINKILSYDLINYNGIHITVMTLIKLIIVFVVIKILLIIIKKGFAVAGKKRGIEKEEWMTFFIILKYFIWLIGITVMLNIIGIDVTMLVAGSSALLIGLGIGMQQLLYDLFAGLILLFEKKIVVGTLIELSNEKVIKITNIKMRFSEGIDRDDIKVIIPNSKLLSDRINFWEYRSKSRFFIDVGVAYGSNPDIVEKLMLKAAKEHNECSKKPEPFVRLTGFGDSSLNFRLIFWSRNKFRINNIKSDLYKHILKLFIENKIQIPFPQMDVHITSTEKK